MNPVVSIGFSMPEPVDNLPIYQLNYTQQQAQQANLDFDQAVKQYLRQWIEQGTLAGVDRSLESESDTETFIEQSALRCFFKHHDDALERLLQQDEIASHLLRPSSQVFFQSDGYEPLLATFERRIYNLAAHREHLEVPFRYSPMSRQGDYGDSINLTDLPEESSREDIGCYFGTRRSDTTALTIIARQLRREALFSSILPVHVVTEGYLEDSLRVIREATQQIHNDGDSSLHCFVVQRRHAADDRHLGAALLLMHTDYPNLPKRIIFCDTLKPSGLPPWWNKFKRYVDVVFPQAEGNPPVSDRLEDGGVNLQRLHDGVPIRHQDIDCAFYSASMARALIQIAKQSPALIIEGSIQELTSQMTQRMSEYFIQADVSRSPELIREINIINRWQTGQEALMDIWQTSQSASGVLTSAILQSEANALGWDTTEQPATGQVPSAA